MTPFATRLVLIALLSGGVLPAADGTISSRSLEWQGMTRTYKVWIPDSVTAAPGVKHPIVFVLHGGGGQGTSARMMVKDIMEPLAAVDGWLIVYPDAYNANWNDDRTFLAASTVEEDAINAGMDDIGFIGAVADALGADPQLNGDKDRFFTTGMSNGAYMSQTLVRAMGSRIAAAAPVCSAYISGSSIGLVYTDSPAATPLIIMAGTADPLVTYGGETRTKGIDWWTSDPTETAVAWWAGFDHAATPPVVTAMPDLDTADGCTAERWIHAQPTSGEGHALHFYKIIGGGHSWPGHTGSGGTGATNQDINASTLIWDFFKQHGRVIPPVVSVAPSGARPTWTWTPGHSVGGAGLFRCALDGAALSTASESAVASFTPASDLSEGFHTLRVQERNAYGTWSISTPASITITLPPSTPTDTNAAADSVPDNAASGTATGLTAFAVDPGGASISYSLSVNPGNRFTINAMTGVVSTARAFTAADLGTYTVTVVASDGGASSSASFTMTISDDLTPPATPAAPVVSGANPTLPTLSGTTDPGASVTIFDGGILVGIVTADGSGVWNWTPATALTSGTHVFTVVATDTAGNASATSTSATVVVPADGGIGGGAGSGTGDGGCGAGGALALFLLPMLAIRRRCHCGR